MDELLSFYWRALCESPESLLSYFRAEEPEIGKRPAVSKEPIYDKSALPP